MRIRYSYANIGAIFAAQTTAFEMIKPESLQFLKRLLDDIKVVVAYPVPEHLIGNAEINTRLVHSR